MLVNGCPSTFFKISRDFQQGCPLSPLLFLLVIEGPSRLIGQAKQDKTMISEKVTLVQFLTHSLFVDGFLLFGNGYVEEWKSFYGIISLFLCIMYGGLPSQILFYSKCYG